jgi:hypothetical protein
VVFQNGIGLAGLDQLANGLNAPINSVDFLEAAVAALTLALSRVRAGTATALSARATGAVSPAAAITAAAIGRHLAARPFLLKRVPLTVCRTLISVRLLADPTRYAARNGEAHG